eukprot:TRINITY_DN2221_c0_g1_i2.p1 TRINITY_DN2221_c0_g1~~TRINITY_DN2221_c0_g1_i2.p1  ORF type:complete len:249 (+),score=30.06 TRINITY_DN2221_c0_g1_i2:96-842(+)
MLRFVSFVPRGHHSHHIHRRFSVNVEKDDETASYAYHWENIVTHKDAVKVKDLVYHFPMKISELGHHDGIYVVDKELINIDYHPEWKKFCERHALSDPLKRLWVPKYTLFEWQEENNAISLPPGFNTGFYYSPTFDKLIDMVIDAGVRKLEAAGYKPNSSKEFLRLRNSMRSWVAGDSEIVNGFTPQDVSWKDQFFITTNKFMEGMDETTFMRCFDQAAREHATDLLPIRLLHEDGTVTEYAAPFWER